MELRHDTDDPELQTLASRLAGRIRPAPQDGASNKKICLRQLLPILQHKTNGPNQKHFGLLIMTAIKYTEAMASKPHPAWHTLTLRAGWTPPSPSK